MKKNIISVLAILLLFGTLQAQTVNLQWAKKICGALDFDDHDQSSSIAVDKKGNIYTAGFFVDTLYFYSLSDTNSIISAGDYDGFVSKYDSTGKFLWAKQIGGTLTDYGYSVAVDANGNVYTTGSFKGTVYFSGTDSIVAAGQYDIFIAKFDSSGNYVWAKGIGGTSKEQGNAIATDADGNVYASGFFSGNVDFDPGPGTFNMNCPGPSAIFICKLNSNGNFAWAKQMGGTINDFAVSKALKVDALGHIYTVGNFSGPIDFNPSAGSDTITSVGLMDIFVSKLDTSGNFIWAKQMGGKSDDYGASVTVDSLGSVYTTGYFTDTADFDPGISSYKLISSGSRDIFISKLNSSGNFVWAKQIGGGDIDNAVSVALDSKANVYTTGSFKGSVDFDPGSGSAILSSDSVHFENVFISKLDASGNFVWAGKMGGTSGSSGTSIAVDSKDNVCTTGIFLGTIDIDPGANVLNFTSTNFGIFLQKLGQDNISGIPEMISGNTMTAFPNPSTDHVNLVFDNKLDHASIALINMMGQTVMEKTNLSGNKILLDVSGQTNGLYMLEVRETGNISRIKLVKN